MPANPQTCGAARALGARMRPGDPLARPGQVVGLLGGSFDPAHAAHVRVTREALKRFGLDQVWWLVSPGNPLKSRGPAPLAERMARARALIDHPRVRITDIEARLGTRYTAQTLTMLQRRYRGVRFVWLMGADNLAQLHRWQDWRVIVQGWPMGILARPEARMQARLGRAARQYRAARVPAPAAQRLGHRRPPAWCFVNMPMAHLSSTEIRARGQWGPGDRD